MAVSIQWGFFLAVLLLAFHVNGQVSFEDTPLPAQPARPQQPILDPNQDTGSSSKGVATAPRSPTTSTPTDPLIVIKNGYYGFPPPSRPASPAQAPSPSPPTVPGTNIECGFSNTTKTRNGGGRDAVKGAWPWMATLGYKDAGTGRVNFLCVGTLVSDQHVVTASHCVHKRNDLAIIRFGTLDLFTEDDEVPPVDVPILEVIENPNYNTFTFVNDIAVIKLKEKVPLSLLIHPICLPTSQEQRSALYENNNPFVVGWVAAELNDPPGVILREAQYTVLSNSACEEKIKAFKSTHVDDTNICAAYPFGGKDACLGHSGGSLMMPQPMSRYILIGVATYNIRCDERRFPGVFSRVTSHVDWIIDTIKK